MFRLAWYIEKEKVKRKFTFTNMCVERKSSVSIEFEFRRKNDKDLRDRIATLKRQKEHNTVFLSLHANNTSHLIIVLIWTSELREREMHSCFCSSAWKILIICLA